MAYRSPWRRVSAWPRLPNWFRLAWLVLLGLAALNRCGGG